MIAPVRALIRSVRERGWKGTFDQLALIGDVKFGDLKGTDKFGNKYYENIDDYPFGQHRWVEYANASNYDASMIQPEWHGWMHHVYDETPNDKPLAIDELKTTYVSHAIYTHHVGLQSPDREKEHASVDLSQYRHRGYKVGSLMIGKDDPELYYKQPGHPLSAAAKKGGRFQPEDEGPIAPGPVQPRYAKVE